MTRCSIRDVLQLYLVRSGLRKIKQKGTKSVTENNLFFHVKCKTYVHIRHVYYEYFIACSVQTYYICVFKEIEKISQRFQV